MSQSSPRRVLQEEAARHAELQSKANAAAAAEALQQMRRSTATQAMGGNGGAGEGHVAKHLQGTGNVKDLYSVEEEMNLKGEGVTHPSAGNNNSASSTLPHVIDVFTTIIPDRQVQRSGRNHGMLMTEAEKAAALSAANKERSRRQQAQQLLGELSSQLQRVQQSHALAMVERVRSLVFTEESETGEFLFHSILFFF